MAKNLASGKRHQNSFQEQTAGLKGVRNAADLEDVLDRWEDDDHDGMAAEPREDYRFTKD